MVPIFIGGQMKSGTTLLRMLVSRHKNIFSGLETHWFSDELYNNYRDTSTKQMQLIKEFFELGDAELKEIIDNKEETEPFINALMGYLTRKNNKKRWLEKTPGNIKNLDLIKEHWKRFKFIHVIRDYRDIYASWKKQKKRDLDYFIEDTKAIYQKAGSYIGQSNDMYLEIRYEDLVTDLKSTMVKVLEFLDEPWDENCLSHDKGMAKNEFLKVKNSTDKESHTLKSTQKDIFTSGIGQWKNILDDDEVVRIEKELKEYFVLFGYSLSKGND